MDLILVLALEGLMGTDLTLVISRAREREGMRAERITREGRRRRKQLTVKIFLFFKRC
jgi:hypothetical protein